MTAWLFLILWIEQYAYMCDLKRTLDATVLNFFIFGEFMDNMVDRATVYWRCRLELGKRSRCYLWLFLINRSVHLVLPNILWAFQVLPKQAKAHLLLADSPRNRESSRGTEAAHGLPGIKGRDWRREREGKTISSIRFDEPEKSLYTPRGTVPVLHTKITGISAHTFVKVSKEKKGKVVDARCRDLTNVAVCEKGREDPGSVELCDWHEVGSSQCLYRWALMYS